MSTASAFTKIVAANGPAAIGPYSPGVAVGEMLYVSGQLPVDPATAKLAEGDIKAQTRQVLKNLRAVLNAGGGDFESVVRCDVFVLDLNDFKAVNEVYAEHFSGAVPPARQTVQVSRLPMDARIEISCIACIRK